MQYTRPMIELVYEIRRRVRADLKPSIKMANPELMQELVDHYPSSKDTITRTLIKELLSLAGEPWEHSLEKGERKETKRQITKVYRGQTSLEAAPQKDPHTDRPARIYRGQSVAD